MRARSRFASVVVASIVALFAFGVTTAEAQNKCIAGKIKCVSKKKACRLNVIAKAYKTGVLDLAKLQKCEDKFDGAADPTKGCFEKLEGKQDPMKAETLCPTEDDTAALEAKVDAFVADVQEELDPGSVIDLNPCTASKLKCVNKKNKCKLGVHSKGFKKGLPPDSAKLQKCEDKFDGAADPTKGCFEKAEAKIPVTCVTFDDTGTLEAKVDAEVLDVVTEVSAPCPQPGDPCPTTVQTDADSSGVDLDTGWTGQSHDATVPSMGRLTLNVSGCDNAVRPCGECNVTGPAENAGGTAFDNQRCQCDTAVQCNSPADCPGACPCVFYFGAPLPLSAGGVSVCVTNEIVGSVTGTVDVEAGTSAALVTLLSRVHTGPTAEEPCPQCNGGTCGSGPHVGDPCTINGNSVLFGNISLDCPPDPGGNIGNLNIPLDLRTGTQTRTLAAGSPTCTAVGFSGSKCFCDTCNNGAAEPCDDNADCPDPPGPTGGICGGRRCIGGGNSGAACAVNSECPGGACGRPGRTTAPNECDDSFCSPNGLDTGSCDEGICAAGPFELFCAQATFRGCTTNGDCLDPDFPGDTCTNGLFRECFTDDTGAIGGDVEVCGAAGAPSCNTANPRLGTLFCIPPTSSSSVNAVSGLPGLGRVTIPSTATFN